MKIPLPLCKRPSPFEKGGLRGIFVHNFIIIHIPKKER